MKYDEIVIIYSFSCHSKPVFFSPVDLQHNYHLFVDSALCCHLLNLPSTMHSVLLFHLIISDPTTEVTLSINPPDRLIKEGDNVEIHCEGNGNPQPFLSLSFKNEEVIFNQDVIIHVMSA